MTGFRGVWHSDTGTVTPVTGSVRLWNGTTASTATFRSLNPNPIPQPPSPPATTVMKFGASGTGSPWGSDYLNRQVAVEHMNSVYWYDSNGNLNWGDISVVPDSHDVWWQTKATTRADYDAMLATFPAKRTGKVYAHYHNEPEDNIRTGGLSMTDWQTRTDTLYAAIADSGKNYVIPSIEIQFQTLVDSQRGTTAPERTISNYLRPGLQQVGFSMYAQIKWDPTQTFWVASTDPVRGPNRIKTFLAANPNLHVSVISGWALKDAGTWNGVVYGGWQNDPTTVQNRANWVRSICPNLQKVGVQHFLWFDINWADGDYRITTEPLLQQAWLDLATAAGQ